MATSDSHHSLHSDFGVTFTKPDPETKDDGSKVNSLSLQQVDNTSCDDIEFILYNKKSLVVDMESTAGSYSSIGTRFQDIDEAVTISGSKTGNVSTPGVVSVSSMRVVGQVLVIRDRNMVPGASGNLLFDMESEEIKWTGEDDIYAVVRIQYRSRGSHYKFNWPSDEGIEDAVIVAVSNHGDSASLTLSRADCKDEEENSTYGDSTSKDVNLNFDLKMDVSWSQLKDLVVNQTCTLGCLLTMYPVHSTGVPDLRAVFGREGTAVECQFDEEAGFPPYRQISEAVNFSSNAIANLGNFVGSFSEFTIAAESAFYDTKNHRVLIPGFVGPGGSVTVEEWVDSQRTYTDPLTQQKKQISVRQQIRYSKRLGPTEVASVTATGLLYPVTGVARANYKVPQKVGVLKVDIKPTESDYKNWMCTVHGSYIYTDLSVSFDKPLAFMGTASIESPVGSSPAKDAREQAIKDKLSS